jgi:hypothetical protein
MMTQTREMPRSLWREQANRWLNTQDIPAPKVHDDDPDDDRDPDPPPAAPALRPWPRVFPGL